MIHHRPEEAVSTHATMIARIIALIMIDLTSLHSCDIIVLVMNDIIHSYVSNVDALDTNCAVAQLAVASDFESDG